jgi:hypothetical protein
MPTPRQDGTDYRPNAFVWPPHPQDAQRMRSVALARLRAQRCPICGANAGEPCRPHNTELLQ